MNDRKVLFGLHELEGVGWKSIKLLESAVSGAWSELRHLSPEELKAAGLRATAAENVYARLRDEASLEKRAGEYASRSISIVTVLDPHYPALLREIAQPPWVLYCKGELNVLERAAIAIVGTRSPTAYGRKAAFDLGRDLSAAGVCVVSGLARGIDSCAHRGALTGEGGTAAILGCGLDTVYPPENASLYDDVTKKGVLLTEYPLGTQLRPGLFPQRNRIISGLSLGTIVVEAASRSGSLITADMALEQSRDVFAVPGPISSPKSEGALELIRQGAKMIASADHVLEEYRHLTRRAPEGSKEAPAPGPSLTEDERKLLGWMTSVPVTFDELLELSGFEFGHLHSVLLNLILIKRITPLPGSSYIAL